MADATNTLENDLIGYLLDSVAPAWATADDFYLSLHTADPGEAGNQTTSETNYGSYARQAVSRTTGFTISGDSGSNAGLVTFPLGSSGSGTITHVGLGTDVSGTGTLLARAALSGTITVGNNIRPEIPIGNLTWTVA